MPSKLKQRRTRRLKADVAWWRAEASDLHARVMEQADEIAELRRTVIRVPMPVIVPAEAAWLIGVDLAEGKDYSAAIVMESGKVING
ncbi:hypothetical protein [Citrobacter braakii]